MARQLLFIKGECGKKAADNKDLKEVRNVKRNDRNKNKSNDPGDHGTAWSMRNLHTFNNMYFSKKQRKTRYALR